MRPLVNEMTLIAARCPRSGGRGRGAARGCAPCNPRGGAGTRSQISAKSSSKRASRTSRHDYKHPRHPIPPPRRPWPPRSAQAHPRRTDRSWPHDASSCSHQTSRESPAPADGLRAPSNAGKGGSRPASREATVLAAWKRSCDRRECLRTPALLRAGSRTPDTPPLAAKAPLPDSGASLG